MWQDNYTTWGKNWSSSWVMNIISGFYCLSPKDSSFCMAPASNCILYSLLQRGHTLLADDLPSAFDWGWGPFTLFYCLMRVHTADFNCSIHTLIIQINAVPLSKPKEHNLKSLIWSYFFFYWSRHLQHHQVFLGTEYIQIMEFSMFNVVTTDINFRVTKVKLPEFFVHDPLDTDSHTHKLLLAWPLPV